MGGQSRRRIQSRDENEYNSDNQNNCCKGLWDNITSSISANFSVFKQVLNIGVNKSKEDVSALKKMPKKLLSDFISNPMAFIDGGEEYELIKNALNLSKDVKAAEEIKEIANEIGILRDASKFKGNFGLGTASATTSELLGKAWVGEEYNIASDGTTLISKDGLRQYRPPSVKNSPFSPTGVQSNFESRNVANGAWQTNGHLDISITAYH